MNSFLIWDKYDNTYKTVVDIKEVNQLQEVINAMANEIYMIARRKLAKFSLPFFNACYIIAYLSTAI